jgi:hypothetical protein
LKNSVTDCSKQKTDSINAGFHQDLLLAGWEIEQHGPATAAGTLATAVLAISSLESWPAGTS